MSLSYEYMREAFQRNKNYWKEFCNLMDELSPLMSEEYRTAIILDGVRALPSLRRMKKNIEDK
jgi:hypothetical protein